MVTAILIINEITVMTDQIEESTVPSDVEPEATLPSQLEKLKARAKTLGIKHHPSIGEEKLRAKINARMDDKPEPIDSSVYVAAAPVGLPKPETRAQRTQRQRKEASRLIRVRISCMNPNKKEWEGEIFTVSNSVVGTFKKYVPFNTEEGWHVPQMILNMIQERKCQVFFTVKGQRGNKVRQGKLIKEFSGDILEPLNQKQREDLAKPQAMANNLG